MAADDDEGDDETGRRLFSTADWYTAEDAPQTARHVAAPGTRGLTALHIASPFGRFDDPPLAEIALQLNLVGPLATRLDLGEGRFATTVRLGEFVVSPAGVATGYDIAPLAREPGAAGAGFEMVAVALPTGLLAALAAERGIAFDGGLAGLHRGVMRDPAVLRLVEMLRPGPTNVLMEDALLVDQLALALGQRLIGLSLEASGTPRRAVAAGPALSPRERARVLDYVDANLARPIAVADLARLLDRPVGELGLLFRIAFATTPYALVVTRRIERAKTLLRLGALPLAEIALACGFSSQAHFTTAFRKATGTTPARWRDAARG